MITFWYLKLKWYFLHFHSHEDTQATNIVICRSTSVTRNESEQTFFRFIVRFWPSFLGQYWYLMLRTHFSWYSKRFNRFNNQLQWIDRKLEKMHRTRKGKFEIRSVSKDTRLTEEKNPLSAMASPPDKGNNYFLFWLGRDMSDGSIRSHCRSSPLPLCPSPRVSWHCRSAREIGRNSRMLRSSARRKKK